jgi:hypothetical protein
VGCVGERAVAVGAIGVRIEVDSYFDAMLDLVFDAIVCCE